MEKNEFQNIINENKGFVLSAIEKNLDPKLSDQIEDILQEAFTRAYRALMRGDFLSQAKLSTYLYAIGRNLAIDHNRKLRNQEKYDKIIKQQIDIKTYSQASTANEFEKQEELNTLYSSISKLPGKYREIINLSLQGYKDREVAEKLKLNLTTIKSRKLKARKVLGDLLTEEGIFIN